MNMYIVEFLTAAAADISYIYIGTSKLQPWPTLGRSCYNPEYLQLRTTQHTMDTAFVNLLDLWSPQTDMFHSPISQILALILQEPPMDEQLPPYSDRLQYASIDHSYNRKYDLSISSFPTIGLWNSIKWHFSSSTASKPRSRPPYQEPVEYAEIRSHGQIV